MTNCYKCDICGTVDEFDNNAAIVSKGEKLHDLCPNCLPNVELFIRESTITPATTQKSPANSIEDAIKILKENHYVVYPVVTKRERKKASNK